MSLKFALSPFETSAAAVASALTVVYYLRSQFIKFSPLPEKSEHLMTKTFIRNGATNMYSVTIKKQYLIFYHYVPNIFVGTKLP